MISEEERTLMRGMNDDELTEFLKQKDLEYAMTVGDLIEYLKKNFSMSDKLCYMDCVEGLRCDCRYVEKDQLGKRFFYYVKDINGYRKDDFRYVDSNDVVLG